MSWKDVLCLTPSERRGVVALVALAVLLAFAPKIYGKFKPQATANYTKLEQAYAALQTKKDSLEKIEALSPSKNYSYRVPSTQNHVPSKSPAPRNQQQPEPSNQYPAQSNQQPAPSNQNQTPSTQKPVPSNQQPAPSNQNLTPSTQPSSTQPTQYKSNKSSTVKIYVNKATAKEFTQLKGIGEVLSKRIIKYRDSRGGFTSLEQVGKVYGIEPIVYENIKAQLVLDLAPIKEVNINTASKEELMANRLIGEKLAEQIINYREKVSPFKNDADVLKLYFVDEALLAKLKPHLSY